MQDFNSFSIMFYYIISATYQKIGDLFCPVHISGLSHSVCEGACAHERVLCGRTCACVCEMHSEMKPRKSISEIFSSLDILSTENEIGRQELSSFIEFIRYYYIILHIWKIALIAHRYEY